MPQVLSFIALRGPNASAPLLANSSTIQPLRSRGPATSDTGPRACNASGGGSVWSSSQQQQRQQWQPALATLVASVAASGAGASVAAVLASFRRVVRLCPELFDETARSIPCLNDAERDCCKLKALAVSTLLNVHLVETFCLGCILSDFRCCCISFKRCNRAVSCGSGPS